MIQGIQDTGQLVEKGCDGYVTFKAFFVAQKVNLMRHWQEHGGDPFDYVGFMQFARQTYNDFI